MWPDPLRPEVLSERRFEGRQVSLDHVANGVDVDAEVLVNEDVPKPSNLRPRDLGMSVGDLLRETGHGFTDDLKIPLDGILSHIDKIMIRTVQRDHVAAAAIDRLENVLDSLLGAAGHKATASERADSETGRLRSCTGKTSMSCLP